MIHTISSFTQINLDKPRTLVLCDIDDTILHFPERDKFCKEIADDFYPNGIHDKTYYAELKKLKEMYVLIKEPKHTDYSGFVSMVNTLKATNGQLMFLTARHVDSDKWTRRQLRKLGINPDEFYIHYTCAMMSKGDYIKQNISFTHWSATVFIDDFDPYIQSVRDICPDITCYKFQAKNEPYTTSLKKDYKLFYK